MKKQFLFLSMAAAVFLHACDKDKDNPTPKPDPTPTPTKTSPSPQTPVINGVHGTLVSVIMDYSYNNPVMPMPITVQSDVAVAAFPQASGSSTLVSAGKVSVNEVELDKADNNAYFKTATMGMTPATLNFSSSSSTWAIAGSGSVTGFNYTHTDAFPGFDGTLPSSVSKSAGVTVALGSDVRNADSVYLTIAAGNQFVLKSVPGTASSVTLTADELKNLPTVSDNTAMIQVVPFRINIQSIGGKEYAFVKERAVVQSINIQ